MMIDAEPRSISQAMESIKPVQWKATTSSELVYLEANDTFEVVNSPAKISIYRLMILKKKLNELRDIEH